MMKMNYGKVRLERRRLGNQIICMECDFDSKHHIIQLLRFYLFLGTKEMQRLHADRECYIVNGSIPIWGVHVRATSLLIHPRLPCSVSSSISLSLLLSIPPALVFAKVALRRLPWMAMEMLRSCEGFTMTSYDTI